MASSRALGASKDFTPEQSSAAEPAVIDQIVTTNAARSENDDELDRSSYGRADQKAKDSTSLAGGDNESEPLAPTASPRSSRTTGSSPTDPAYVPDKVATGGHFVRPPRSPTQFLRSATRPVSMAERSFFESDTGSEDDEQPVIGRASSVRMSRPSIVEQHRDIHGRKVRQYDVVTDGGDDRPGSTLSHRISEASDSVASDEDTGDRARVQASEISEEQDTEQSVPTKQIPEAVRQGVGFSEGLSDRARGGGLSMNPVTENEKTNNVSGAVLAPTPPIPQRLSSRKKVTIRPLDLVMSNARSGGDTSRFRETVVTTPYPVLNDTDEKLTELYNDESNGKVLTLPPPPLTGFTTINSAQPSTDRFPSPDRSEILFLDLGLAHRPSTTTTLEIKITDKGSYDDEALFRQIRAAYRERLLGLPRFWLVGAVRRPVFATVSPSSSTRTVGVVHEHDNFDPADFIAHFHRPRVGRGRKNWVIWLRHHARCRHQAAVPIPAGASDTVRSPPVSASLRSAADKKKKRPSSTPSDSNSESDSDSSQSESTFHFSFPPHRPLSIGRLPFLDSVAVPPPTYRSSAASHRAHASESGTGTDRVKIELHHEFSFWSLVCMHAAVVLLSVAAVVFWVCFGVPGSRPGGHDAGGVGKGGMMAVAVAGEEGGVGSWKTAAQSRVLTGLVLGVTVAVLGSLVEVGLIVGASVLL